MFCKNLCSHFYDIWEEVSASLAYRYFDKVRLIHASRFPQVCCYSFDHISQEINFDGQFEKAELFFLTTKLHRYMSEKTVLDIGANIGNHSLAFSSHCKQVFAFEPHPKTFQLLKLNSMEVNNIYPINIGASDRVVKMKATGANYNMGGAKVIDDSLMTNGGDDNNWEYSLQPLDFMEQLKDVEIGFIKIDVEGHELQVLKGSRELLIKHYPLIAFEQLEDSINFGTSDVIEFLKYIGYRKFFALKKKQDWHFKTRIMKFFEAIFLGIPKDKIELLETSYFQKSHYNMIIASLDSIEQN